MADHRQTLLALEADLLRSPRRPLIARGSWASDVPNVAGVYAIWERRSNLLVYVGETSDLRSRLSDLGRYPNHTFRRTAAKRLHVERSAGEAVLSAAIAKRYEIAFLPVAFGRAELEEYLGEHSRFVESFTGQIDGHRVASAC